MTTNNNMKIKINDKQYTFRFNADKLRFECNYGFKDNNGIRQSRRLTGRSVDELTENLKAFIKQINDNSIINKSITLESFFDFYIKTIAPATNNHRTIKSKEFTFKRLPTYVKEIQVTNLTVSILQEMYNSMRDKYSQNTIAGVSELISTILNQAVIHNIITENINKKCAVKSFRNGKKKYISPKEIKMILNYTRTHIKYRHLYAPLLFLSFTGCRIGECLGLQKQNLDKDNNTVKIQTQITQGEFDDKLKTESSNRIIKVPEFVMKELLWSAKVSKNNFVFTNFNYATKKEYISYCSFIRGLQKIFKDCGLEYRSAKQFRNSFAKTAILNGIPLKVIQNILGHTKISTTADIYGELESKDTFFVADTFVKAYTE